MIAHVLIALVVSSNASGKTLVRQQQGTLVPMVGYSGPLIADDPNTVAHVTWNGSALADSKGNAWAMTGTVPQVAKNGKTPPAAGAYSDSNFYGLGTGNDVLDFTGNFTFCAVLKITNTGGPVVPFINAASGTDGYWLQVGTGATDTQAVFASGGNKAATAAAPVINGAINVVCMGRSGTTGYIKSNLGATVSVINVGLTAATSNIAKIGKFESAGSSFSTGYTVELWWTTTTYTDALAIAVMQRVKNRTGTVAW